jgi:hypothetical protein
VIANQTGTTIPDRIDQPHRQYSSKARQVRNATRTSNFSRPKSTITVIRRFAQNGTALDDAMGQLVEVLAQMLEEPQERAEKAVVTPAEEPIAPLHLGSYGVIHVVGAKAPDDLAHGA